MRCPHTASNPNPNPNPNPHPNPNPNPNPYPNPKPTPNAQVPAHFDCDEGQLDGGVRTPTKAHVLYLELAPSLAAPTVLWGQANPGHANPGQAGGEVGGAEAGGGEDEIRATAAQDAMEEDDEEGSYDYEEDEIGAEDIILKWVV